MSQYFLKPYEPFGRDINVKVDLNKVSDVVKNDVAKKNCIW